MAGVLSGYVALVGRPNVGKSTLFNWLTRTRAAIVDDQPGVTRDRHYGRMAVGERISTLIDTGGFEPGARSGLSAAMKAQVEMAMVEADVIVFLMDGREGLNPIDRQIAGLLRRQTKPVVAAVNKLDSPEAFHLTAEFYELGLENVLPLSAAHGLGLDELVEAMTAALPPLDQSGAELDLPAEVIRLAVVGRPNVGKSSLINRLLGAERMVVSAQPGTTRDAVDVLIKTGQRPYLLIDTAGIRRAGRVQRGVERWSVLRALKALDRADVAVVMVEAEEGLTDQEARICGLAEERGRAVILALNKWDLIQDPRRKLGEIKREISLKLKFLGFAPLITISALTGRNLPRLFETTERLFEQYTFRAPTGEVNRVLEEAVRRHQPPLIGGKRLKFLFATQAETRPPTFVVFTNQPRQVHFSYARFLTNRFKEAFGLNEIPIKVVFRARRRRR